MRTSILIASLILASTAAQAGDSRSLSTNSIGLTTAMPGDKPAPAAEALRVSDTPAQPATRTDTPRYAPPPAAATAQSEPTPPSPPDAPRYTTRPAPVEATSPAPAERDTPRDEPSYRPSRARYHHVSADQRRAAMDRPHGYRHVRWTAGRIIAQLHRYGIYW